MEESAALGSIIAQEVHEPEVPQLGPTSPVTLVTGVQSNSQTGSSSI